MCAPKVPEGPKSEPPPAPAPMPVAAETSPIETADKRRAKIDSLKYGILSTIKTGPRGVTGAGPELSTPVAGGMYGGPFKQKLGE